MGSVCSRRKEGGDLSFLGIADEYDWEGLAEDRIEAYELGKDKLFEEFAEKLNLDADDKHWLGKLPAEAREALKSLLVRRAIGLVHVLKPIEEQRTGMRRLHAQDMVSPQRWASFGHAEALCSQELKAVMEECQILSPEAPPNAVIQAAVRIYNQHGLNWPQGPGGGAPQQQQQQQGGANTEEPPPPFKKGQKVVWKSYDEDIDEGEVGEVVGGHRNGSVRVQFKRGTWALPAHEVLTPEGEAIVEPPKGDGMSQEIVIHPNAREVPTAQLQIVLKRDAGEKLGIKLNHDPPEADQKPGQPSTLVVQSILPGGYGEKYNKAADAKTQLRPGDRILAIVDGGAPESERKPVGGNSNEMLNVITKDGGSATPLVFLIARPLGPPLRFKVGQRVKANLGDNGWAPGVVVGVWVEDPNGQRKPYAVRIMGTGGVVVAPKDHDDVIVKADPRFQAGDKIMANQGGGYQQGTVVEVKDEPCRTAYRIKLEKEEGKEEGDNECFAPEDVNQFVRPVARFKKGDKVMARVSGGQYAEGVVEDMYNPEWVYTIRLTAQGNTVMAPEDSDGFVKAWEETIIA